MPAGFRNEKPLSFDRGAFWRRHPDLNRGSGICSPVPYHLAMAPDMRFADAEASANRFVGAAYEARTRYLHLGKVALYRMS